MALDRRAFYALRQPLLSNALCGWPARAGCQIWVDPYPVVGHGNRYRVHREDLAGRHVAANTSCFGIDRVDRIPQFKGV